MESPSALINTTRGSSMGMMESLHDTSTCKQQHKTSHPLSLRACLLRTSGNSKKEECGRRRLQETTGRKP